MLRSTFCSLHECSDKELTELGECPYDQVRLICSAAGAWLCNQRARGTKNAHFSGTSAAGVGWADGQEAGQPCTRAPSALSPGANVATWHECVRVCVRVCVHQAPLQRVTQCPT